MNTNRAVAGSAVPEGVCVCVRCVCVRCVCVCVCLTQYSDPGDDEAD